MLKSIQKKASQIIGGIFYSGINDAMEFNEVIKTFMFNLYIVISLPFILSFVPINIIHKNYHLLSLNIILFSLYLFGLWANIKRRFLWGRQWVLILATFIFFIGPVLYNNGTEFNMLLILMAAVILFDKNIYFFIFAIVVIAALTFLWYRPVQDITVLSSKTVNHYTNIFYSEILFVISIFSFKYIYFKYQKQLQLAYEQLRESEKRRNEIVQFVEHDLRNPIGAIVNFLDIVQLKYEHSEGEEKILQSMSQAATHSINLINDLHEVRITLGERKNIDINQLAEQAAEQMRHKANAKQQTILVKTTGSPLFVSVDVNKLRRVLINLLDNAIKFSYAHNETVVTLLQQGNQVLVKVTEKGIGIPDSLKTSLLQAGTTVGRRGTHDEPSNGFGLSICKQIVEAHGGGLELESEEGKGSTFTVVLPTVN